MRFGIVIERNMMERKEYPVELYHHQYFGFEGIRVLQRLTMTELHRQRSNYEDTISMIHTVCHRNGILTFTCCRRESSRQLRESGTRTLPTADPIHRTERETSLFFAKRTHPSHPITLFVGGHFAGISIPADI